MLASRLTVTLPRWITWTVTVKVLVEQQHCNDMHAEQYHDLALYYCVDVFYVCHLLKVWTVM